MNMVNVEKLIFDYHLVDCQRKNNIYSSIPYYMNKNLFLKLVDYSEILDKLCRKIISGLNNEYSDYIEYIKDFPYKDKILNLSSPVSEIFWVRYDAFLKESGGFFFSEFNYDKPCAQREIMYTGSMDIKNNVNKDFEKVFIDSFKDILIKNLNKNKTKYNIAILVDPCHYEEFHLAMLYKSRIENDMFNFIIVGPKNFEVINNKLYAFEKEIDVILRQFPTEYSSEIDDFDKIIELVSNNKVLILNDPRVIAIQCKTLFSYFWQLVKNNDKRLSEKEKNIIKECIPYTEILNSINIQYAEVDKNKYVIKPIYGRYSEDVYIGILHTKDEWKDVIKYVKDKKDDFILQEFCQIKKDASVFQDKERFIPKEAFCNFGVHLTNGIFSGICPRWTNGYLTCEEDTWISPIGYSEKSLSIEKVPVEGKERYNEWKKINEEVLFKHSFTGIYNKNDEYIGLDSLILNKKKYNELKWASEKITKIFSNVTKIVQDNFDSLGDVLGIDSLKNVATQKLTDNFTAVGRMDWVLDTQDNLNLLEINSETPAGLVESLYINDLIYSRFFSKFINPNSNLKMYIKESFKKILKDYSKQKDIKNIAVLSSTYYEDWYTCKAIYDILKELPYNVIQENIFDAEVYENKIYLQEQPMDAVFRYYPLDWFIKDEMEDTLNTFISGTLSINPPSTIISQSKAFFALIWELNKQHLLTKEDSKIIEKYIPYTSLDVDLLNTTDFYMKPILDREGIGIKLSSDVSECPKFECVFQERVNIEPVEYTVHATDGFSKKLLYPVIGTFITSDKFAGIYTRLGNLVTDRCCIYAPLYVK